MTKTILALTLMAVGSVASAQGYGNYYGSGYGNVYGGYPNNYSYPRQKQWSQQDYQLRTNREYVNRLPTSDPFLDGLEQMSRIRANKAAAAYYNSMAAPPSGGGGYSSYTPPPPPKKKRKYYGYVTLYEDLRAGRKPRLTVIEVEE